MDAAKLTLTSPEPGVLVFESHIALQEFPTKEAMVEEYARTLMHEQNPEIHSDNGAYLPRLATLRLMAASRCKYTPHLYRGGWVIPEYGYSVERIGKNIEVSRAGNPLLIERG
jgi:hypothetical protein